ncbi:MAG: hypothetical protein HY821_17505 [Acidobacteria bacterium]|nr:hypothetical protein [Acidobacteriota bacterium]
MQFPSYYLVRQKLPSRVLADIPAAVSAQLDAAGLATGLKPGAQIAIGVGSRGIANLDQIVGAAVAWWKSKQMRPFLFPAMGSHGAATGPGQAEVLARYGLTESSMGCPVRSSLAVVKLGRTPEGIDVVMDRTAFQADGVMLCARVKRHTDFAGKLESGLFKMMAIGLGKLAGAQHYHAHGHQIGLEAVIRSVGRQVLGTGKILGGLAILEDAHHQTAHLEVVPVARMERREEELIELSKSWMPRIPLDSVDFLIVNELGKNWSGSGMDPKVINRDIHGNLNPWDSAPQVGRIYVRNIHPLSHGNAIGIGMADAVHRQLVRKMERKSTYVNGLTSGALACLKTPAAFPSDRACLEAIWKTTGRLDPSAITYCWIRNTQDLTELAISVTAKMRKEQEHELECLGEPRPLRFDERGDLVEALGV